MKTALPKQCVAEFVGTFALIFIGIGSICRLGKIPNNGGLLGLAIAVILGGGLAGLISARFLIKQSPS